MLQYIIDTTHHPLISCYSFSNSSQLPHFDCGYCAYCCSKDICFLNLEILSSWEHNARILVSSPTPVGNRGPLTPDYQQNDDCASAYFGIRPKPIVPLTWLSTINL